MNVELVNFDEPTETREFENGRCEVYRVGPTTLGRATYEPGRRWSEHVSPAAGTPWCEVEHVGLVLSGRAAAKMKDGGSRQLGGRRRPYVSLHIVGSED